jgi:hypothetical protein
MEATVRAMVREMVWVRDAKRRATQAESAMMMRPSLKARMRRQQAAI